MRKITITLSLLLSCALASCASNAAQGATISAPRRSADLFTVDLLGGGHADLAKDLEAGRPLALVFWQAWCGSCIAEAPAVQVAYETYGDRMRIVGVVSGPDDGVDEAKLNQQIMSLGLEYDQVRDRDMSLTKHFGVTGTPTIVILGAKGNVLYNEHHVPSSWDAFL